MPEVPKFHELMWPTLKAIKELGGSATNSEIVDKVIVLESIPEAIQNIPHTAGSKSKLEYNLAWARSYLKAVGALDNSERGIWSLTDSGLRVSPDEIKSLVSKARTAGHESRKNRPETSQVVEELDFSDWKDKLINLLRTKLSPQQFERLTQRLLRESGFTEVEVTGKSGDGGVDGYGILRIGLLSFKVIFQCKRYKDSVGPGEIRDFRGAMQGRADKGLFVTTGTFTKSAKDEATRDGAPPIDLIDGDELCNLLKNLKLGISIEIQEIAHINEKWFESI